MDGEGGHVHVLAEYPPRVSVKSLANSLKGVSSRLLDGTAETPPSGTWKGVLWSLTGMRDMFKEGKDRAR